MRDAFYYPYAIVNQLVKKFKAYKLCITVINCQPCFLNVFEGDKTAPFHDEMRSKNLKKSLVIHLIFHYEIL